jgi:GGDEF domain-containing protein
MNYKDFSSKIKTKYPDYADMDDRTLAEKMVAKYPEYSDVTFDDSVSLPENKMDAIPYLKDMAPKASTFRSSPLPMNKDAGYGFGDEINMPVVTGGDASEATQTRSTQLRLTPAEAENKPEKVIGAQLKPDVPKSEFDSFLAGASNIAGGKAKWALGPRTRTFDENNPEDVASYERGEAVRKQMQLFNTRTGSKEANAYYQNLTPQEKADYDFSRTVSFPGGKTGIKPSQEDIATQIDFEQRTQKKAEKTVQPMFDAADNLVTIELQSNDLKEKILDRNIYNDMHQEAYSSGDLGLQIDLLSAQAAARGDNQSAEIVKNLRKEFDNRYAHNIPTEKLKEEFQGAIKKLKTYTDLKTEYDTSVRSIPEVQSLQQATEQSVYGLPKVKDIIARYQAQATPDMTPGQVTALNNDLLRAIEQLPEVQSLYKKMNSDIVNLDSVKQLHQTFNSQIDGIPEVQALGNKLNTDIEKLNPRNTNWFTKLTTSTTEMLPPMIKGAALSAIPIVGNTAAYTMWALQGEGNTYNNLITDGVDPQEARKVAAVVGPIYAAVEKVQFGKLTRMPGFKEALSKGLGKAVWQLGKEFTIDWVKEWNEEGWQGLIQTVGEEYAKGTKPEEIAKLGIKSYVENVKGSYKQLALIGAPAKVGSLVKAVADKKAAGMQTDITDDTKVETPKIKVDPVQQINTEKPQRIKTLSELNIKDEEFWNQENRDEIFKELSPEEQHRLLTSEEKDPETETLKNAVVNASSDMTEEDIQKTDATIDATKRAILEHNRPLDIQKEVINVNTDPTDKQKDAGNYRKGHIKRDGLDISIENFAGSSRNGVDESGNQWSQPINHDYGYIKGTVGKDKDHLDVFIKPDSDMNEGGNVFIVNQVNPKTGAFDEHKVMMGFTNKEEAETAYLSNYEPGWKGAKSVVEMPMDTFKQWIKTDATKKEVLPLSSRPIQKGMAHENQSASQETETLLTGESPDLRVDPVYRKKVSEMTPEEMKTALLSDDLTGIANRRAYDESDKQPIQGIADIDSLKTVNDTYGYQAGDTLINAVAHSLKSAGLSVYRIGGDEIRYQEADEKTVEEKLKKAYNILSGVTIDLEDADGKKYQWKGAGFSYGHSQYDGKDLETAHKLANDKLHTDKSNREALGIRSPRGERIRGLVEQPSNQGQIQGKNDGTVSGRDNLSTPITQNPATFTSKIDKPTAFKMLSGRSNLYADEVQSLASDLIDAISAKDPETLEEILTAKGNTNAVRSVFNAATGISMPSDIPAARVVIKDFVGEDLYQNFNRERIKRKMQPKVDKEAKKTYTKGESEVDDEQPENKVQHAGERENDTRRSNILPDDNEQAQQDKRPDQSSVSGKTGTGKSEKVISARPASSRKPAKPKNHLPDDAYTTEYHQEKFLHELQVEVFNALSSGWKSKGIDFKGFYPGWMNDFNILTDAKVPASMKKGSLTPKGISYLQAIVDNFAREEGSKELQSAGLEIPEHTDDVRNWLERSKGQKEFKEYHKQYEEAAKTTENIVDSDEFTDAQNAFFKDPLSLTPEQKQTLESAWQMNIDEVIAQEMDTRGTEGEAQNDAKYQISPTLSEQPAASPSLNDSVETSVRNVLLKKTGVRNAVTRAPRPDTEEHKIAEALAKEFGSDLMWFTQSQELGTAIGGIGGIFVTNNELLEDVIFINKKMKIPILNSVGHELLHRMRQKHPDLYNKLLKVFVEEASEDFVNDFKSMIIANPSMPTDIVREELIAEFTGQEFANKRFWDKLFIESPDAFNAAIKIIHDLIAKALRYLRVYADNPLVNDIERVRDILVQVTKEYKAREKSFRSGMFDTSDALFQKEKTGGPQPDDKTLIALHNLSEEGLQFANSFGGLPAPSLAITQILAPFEGFGEISLIVDTDLINPEINSVYNSDIYSPRFPEVEYKPNKKPIDTFRIRLSNARRKYESTTGEGNIEGYLRQVDAKSFKRYASQDTAIIGMFLEDNNIQVDPVMKPEDLNYQTSAYSRTKVMRDFFDQYNTSSEMPSPDNPIYYEMLKKATKEIYDSAEDKRQLAALKKIYPIPTKEQYERSYHIPRYLIQDSQTLKNNVMTVDRGATDELLKKEVEKIGNDKLTTWVNSNARSMFINPYIVKGKTKLPVTMDNVLDIMLSKSIRGSEKTMTFGLGKARSAGSKRLLSVDKIRLNKESIIANAEFEKIKKDNGQKFFGLSDMLQNRYEYSDNWSRLDDLSKSIFDYFKGSKTAASLRGALSKNGFKNLKPEELQDVMDFAEALRTMPTEYFEAKIERAVNLKEFKGAVIPSSATDETKALLTMHGIPFVEYDRFNNQDRWNKVRSFSKESGLLFQKQNQIDLFGGADLSGEPILDLFGQQAQLFGKQKKSEDKKETEKPVEKSPMQKELDDLLQQRETLRTKHMEKYRNNSATRAQTTTHNARVSDINDRITFLRNELKKEAANKPIHTPKKYETGDLFAGTELEDTRSKTKKQIDAEVQRREQEKKLKRKENIFEGTPLFDKNKQEARATRQETLPLFQRAIGNSGAFDASNSDIRFQREKTQDPFYSPLLKAVEGLKQEKGTGEQFFAMITKAPGVKEAEWKWLGLDDFLKDKKNVTKEEFIKFIRDNNINIAETKLEAGQFNREDALARLQDELREEANSASFRDGGYWYDNVKEIRKQELKKIHDSKETYIKKDDNGDDVTMSRFTYNGKSLEYDEDSWGFDGDDTLEEDFGLDSYDYLFDLIPQNEKSDEIEEAVENHDFSEQLNEMEEEFSADDGATRYKKYKLNGGENYRELLLINKNDPNTLAIKKRTEIFNKYIADINTAWINGNNAEAERLMQLRDKEADKFPLENEDVKTYKSSHWDTKNVFAHTRVDDRTFGGEKVLFVEEIQSDWERESRQKGIHIKSLPSDVVINKIVKKINVQQIKTNSGFTAFVVNDEDGKRLAIGNTRIEAVTKAHPNYKIIQDFNDTDGTVNITAEYYQAENADLFKHLSPDTLIGKTREDVEQRILAVLNVDAVPDFPFRKNWHEVVLKRILRLAAEGNYDRVAWVTGKQTADRYNLAKYVESIGYQKRGENNYNIAVYRKSDNTPLWRSDHATINDIEEQVGKDIAQKIQDGVGDKEGNITYLNDINLTMGGEWAVNLYDKLIPQFFEKYGKKWNTKVESIDMNPAKSAVRGWSDNETIGVQKSITITDEMKNSVLYEGQPLFQKMKTDQEHKNVVIGDKHMLNLIKNIDLDQYDYENIGIRVVGEDYDEYNYSVGDTLPNSKRWDEGDYTDDELIGTSAIDVTAPGLLRGNYTGAAGYFGKKVMIIGTNDSADKGEDMYEIVMEKAKILDIFYADDIVLGKIIPISNALFQKIKSPLAPLEKLQEASERVEERLRRSQQYQSEINRLRYQLRQLPEDALDKRALIEVKIDKATDKRVDEIKQGIYDYAAKIGLRGVPYNKVDLLLKNAKTIAALQRALNTMDQVYDRTRISELRKEVYNTLWQKTKKLNRLQSAKVPSNVDLEGNRALRDYIDKLMFKADSVDKDRLQKLLTWLQRDATNKLSGSEMEDVPKSLLDWLDDMSQPIPSIAEEATKGLFSQSLDSMTANELQDVLDEIKSIEATGKSRRSIQSAERAAKEVIAIDAMSSEIIRKRDTFRDRPIKAKTLDERRKESSTLLRTIKELPWQLRDIDRIIVALTGKVSGTALEKYILKPMAEANSRYKRAMKSVDAFVKKTYGKLDITELRKDWLEIATFTIQPDNSTSRFARVLTKEEGMFIYAKSKNLSQAEHLYATINHTDRNDAIRVVNEVVAKLPEELKAAVEAQWEYFDKVQWGRMNEVFAKAHNIDMGHEQFYMPATNLDRGGDGINIDADLFMRAARQASADIGSTKNRIVMGPDPRVTPQEGPIPVKAAPYKDMLYISAIVPAMRQAEHYIAFYDVVYQVNRYLSNTQFQYALDAHDTAVAPVLSDWLKAMAYGKWEYGLGGKHPLDLFIRYFRGAAGRYQILGRVTSLLLQASSAPRGFINIPAKYALSSLGQLMRNPREYWRVIDAKSSEIEGRMKDWDQTISEWAESDEGKKLMGKFNPVDRAAEILGNIIGGYDKFWASYIWYAKYAQSLDKNLSEEDAIYEADKVIRKTQSGGGILASNRIQRGGDLYRAFTQFLSDAVKAYNLIDETIMGWKSLPAKERAAYIVFGLLAPALMTHLVRSGGDPTKDPLNYAKELIMQVTGAVPIVGQAIDFATIWGINKFKENVLGIEGDKFALSYAGDFTPPAISMAGDIYGELAAADKAKSVDKALYHTFNAVALATGLPGGGQIKRTWGGLDETAKTGSVKNLILPKSAAAKPKHLMIAVLGKTSRKWNEERGLLKFYDALSDSAKSAFLERAAKELQSTIPDIADKISEVRESYDMQGQKMERRLRSLDRKLDDGDITQKEYITKKSELERDFNMYNESLQK